MLWLVQTPALKGKHIITCEAFIVLIEVATNQVPAASVVSPSNVEVALKSASPSPMLSVRRVWTGCPVLPPGSALPATGCENSRLFMYICDISTITPSDGWLST